MDRTELGALKRLADLGDKQAAQALMDEGKRCGDMVLCQQAAVALGSGRTAVRSYSLRRTSRLNANAINLDDNLNEEQRAVVEAGAGPLLVIAGAGTGKTRTLTYRVAHLISRGVSPDNIMLLTFTNKAAREMVRRVGDLVGPRATRVWGGTFHHVAHRILRQHAQRLGYPAQFNIMDSEDCATLMGVCAADVKLPDPQRRFPKGAVIQRIYSMAVNTMRSIHSIVAQKYSNFEDLIEPIQAVCVRYLQRKLEMGLMDYDDLLINWRRLFQEHPDVALHYSSRFEHLLVDEYQDVNVLQADIVDLMAKTHRNVMVVGDDSQCIYGFRGAHFESILTFPERYDDTHTFLLETNYRSTPQILALANTSIRFNQRRYDKVLRAVRSNGMHPALVPCRDMEQQAAFVTERILELHETDVPLSNIAVLYRAHYQSVELQMALTRANIPFSLRSGMRFFEQAHIKDVLAHLRLIFNPRDELSFVRVAKLCPGIGDRYAQRLWNAVCEQDDPIAALNTAEVMAKLPKKAFSSFERLAALLQTLAEPERHVAPGEMVGLVIDGDYTELLRSAFRNAENRAQDLEQLARYAAQFDSLEGFLDELALMTSITGEDVGEEGKKEDYVVLSSVHQAKGLEWPVVFVSSLWDGGFPSGRGQASVEQEEEERRLFYVAITRAMDELYLTYPLARRDRDGWYRVLRPSPFINELAEMHLEEPALGMMEVWQLGAE